MGDKCGVNQPYLVVWAFEAHLTAVTGAASQWSFLTSTEKNK